MPATVSSSYLEIANDQGHVRTLPLQGTHMVVGRASQAEVHLESTAVSRRHAELFTDQGGQWWVRDLGSRNGTLVNGVAVQEQPLRPGDVVQIEEYRLTLLSPRQADHALPAAKPPAPTAGSTATLVINRANDSSHITHLHDLESPQIEAAHLKHLTRLSADLLAEPDPAGRLRLLCDLLVGKQFHGLTATVFRLDRQADLTQQQPMPLCDPASSRNWRGGELPYLSQTILRSVLQHQVPVMASNVTSDGTDMVALSLAGNVVAMCVLACPLHVDEQSMDMLYVTLPGECSSAQWLALAALAAELHQQAESAWQARRLAEQQALINQDLQRARQIQLRLIPEQINIQGIDAAIGFRPCHSVGGDYVDMVPMPTGQVLTVMADVCGKGLQAALITATLHCLTHTTHATDVTITHVMQRLNTYLCNTLPESSFVTLIGIMLDPNSGEFQLVNAGHPPALLMPTDGNIRQLQSAANPPLGLMPTEMTCQSGRLQAGDCLLLYTDGLTELSSGPDDHAQNMLGIQGVCQFVQNACQQAGPCDAHAIAQQLEQQLLAYQGPLPQQDDHTYLLICKR